MSVVCSICGGARMTCTAVVDPNTEVFAEFGFEAFCDGPCADCGSVVLTDPDGVGREIGRRYTAFRAESGNAPCYALCAESGSTRRYENELNE